MPLDEVGQRYAARLFQDKFEEILGSQGTELLEVRDDFARRNMSMSGPYFTAYGRVLVKHIGLLAEAKANALLQAYEKAGLPFDDAALQEISTEVTQFCEQQQRNASQAVRQHLAQTFSPQGAPPGASDAISGEIQRGISAVAVRLTRRLDIKRDEVILDERKTRKVYAAGLGKEWDVFISHASEDKEDFVRPLANALTDSGLRVWYDETTLRVGDRLREAIDNGLARSRYGIVVLSRHFFAKQWPREELEGLTSKEVSGLKVILPVWHNISADVVEKFSPTLAGRLAAKSSEGMDKVVRDIRRAMGL